MTNSPLPSRRELLRGSAAAAAGAGVSAWLQRGFTPQVTNGEPASDPIAAAIEAAAANGLPLLVLIVPDDEHERRQRARDLGAILLHGKLSVRATLATCELVCATQEHLLAQLPKLKRELYSDSSVALLEPDNGKGHALSLNNGSTPDEIHSFDRAGNDARLKSRIGVLARQLEDFLVVRPSVLRRRARTNAAATGLAIPEEPAALDLDLVQRAPAVARQAAEDSLAREAWLRALSGRLDQHAAAIGPRGARWAVSSSCGGERVEGETGSRGPAGPCGVGHTPELTRRFLWFYTDE